MTTLRELFKLDRVKPYKLPYAPKDVTSPYPDLLYGVELEIENASFDYAEAATGFRAVEDGSLRNNGVEFISRPMTYANLVTALESFFAAAKNMGFRGDENNYTDRTSIHVHTNCQEMTLSHVTSILLLYQIVESLLFQFIGHDRDKNIFCVPWSETQTAYDAAFDLEKFISYSSVERNKYTALNLVPLRSQGTLEWRHMAGNCDLNFIKQWLTLISHFYRIAWTVPLEDIKTRTLSLNTTSQYDVFLDWLFQGQADLLRFLNHQLLLEDGVLNMKYSLLSQGSKKKEVKSKKMTLRQGFLIF